MHDVGEHGVELSLVRMSAGWDPLHGPGEWNSDTHVPKLFDGHFTRLPRDPYNRSSAVRAHPVRRTEPQLLSNHAAESVSSRSHRLDMLRHQARQEISRAFATVDAERQQVT